MSEHMTGITEDNGWRCRFCVLEVQRECDDSICLALASLPDTRDGEQ